MPRTISPTEPISTIATAVDGQTVTGTGPDVLVAAPEDSIVVVGARMLEAGAQRVVLCDRQHVVGIVALGDVLKVVLAPWVARLGPFAPGLDRGSRTRQNV